MSRSEIEEVSGAGGYGRRPEEYEIVEKLNVTPSTVVYKAKKTGPGKEGEMVSIKVMDYDEVCQKVYFVGQEIKVAEMAFHRSLVRVYCSFVSERKLWVVMPFEIRCSVKEAMRGLALPCLPLRTAAFVLKEVLHGLCFLHEKQKMLHRHVDVDHIFLDANSDVKLVFDTLVYEPGRMLAGKDTDATGSGSGSSTTHVLVDPRLYADVNSYDFSSDVFGFGVAALHLVHGCVPIKKADDLNLLLEKFMVQKQETKKRRRRGFNRLMSCAAPRKAARECRDDDNCGYEPLIDMVRRCLDPDGSKRPSPRQLMDHPFFSEEDRVAEIAFKNMMMTMMTKKKKKSVIS